MNESHKKQVQKGERFQFGKNWTGFLTTLNEERIKEAEDSLKSLTGISDFSGKKFLDIGSGSGLFSLAARKMGAEVYSFDYDPDSVACTTELKRIYFKDDDDWTVTEGSALDKAYIESLGKFDVVYSWGVLHHTGSMHEALRNAALPVSDGGILFIAIYNDQRIFSEMWKKVKKIYCKNIIGATAVCLVFFPYFFMKSVISSIIQYKSPFKYFSNYREKRGMSIFHDWIDWLGGYPFEVAKPEELLEFYRGYGFNLINMVTTNGLGCNQLVFIKK